MTEAVDREIARLDRLAKQLDAKFRLPLTRFRFGWDSIIGLIPGVGDALVAAPSAYMIYRGHQLGARKSALIRMSANTGLDFVLGSVPVIGDILDFGFKANLRNSAILKEELLGIQKKAMATPKVID